MRSAALTWGARSASSRASRRRSPPTVTRPRPFCGRYGSWSSTGSRASSRPILGRASRLTRVPRRSPTVHVARLGGYYRPHAYRHADVWVGNTRGICDHLIRLGHPAARVHHITNFVERVDEAEARLAEGPLRKDTGVRDEAQLVFALGRCVAKKGFADLVLAFLDLYGRVTRRRG
jgi:hypothetical protein